MRTIRFTQLLLVGLVCCLSLNVRTGADESTGEHAACACESGGPCPCCLAAKGATLCGQCGHEKGSEACCADDCVKCEKCGLHAGAILCCKLDEGEDGKDLCATCGHEAGSEGCCDEDCERCEKCGLHAGAALCCKFVACEGCESGPCARCMAATDIVLCGTCGHIRGAKECCDKDCEKCDCGFHADSVLCCKLDSAKDGVDLCTKCGHAAGSEACCDEECEKCEKCGMHAGSVLCCKLVAHK